MYITKDMIFKKITQPFQVYYPLMPYDITTPSFLGRQSCLMNICFRTHTHTHCVAPYECIACENYRAGLCEVGQDRGWCRHCGRPKGVSDGTCNKGTNSCDSCGNWCYGGRGGKVRLGGQIFKCKCKVRMSECLLY